MAILFGRNLRAVLRAFRQRAASRLGASSFGSGAFDSGVSFSARVDPRICVSMPFPGRCVLLCSGSSLGDVGEVFLQKGDLPRPHVNLFRHCGMVGGTDSATAQGQRFPETNALSYLIDNKVVAPGL